MMQLVDALNKAVASEDRESMFHGADEQERFLTRLTWMFSKISMRFG